MNEEDPIAKAQTMPVGTRVKFNQEGLDLHTKTPPDRLGTVTGKGRQEQHCVVVRWDGIKSPMTLSAMFLELAKPDPAADSAAHEKETAPSDSTPAAS